MYLYKDLEKRIFSQPYEDGYRILRILTGYASSPFLYHIVDSYPEIKLELTIGMAGKDGIRKFDHEQYKKICLNNPNVTVRYHTDTPGIHSKIYSWDSNGFRNKSDTYIGSANFSWNGFRDQTELMTTANYENVNHIFNSTNSIDCTDSTVENYITFYELGLSNSTKNFEIIKTPLKEQKKNVKEYEHVDLSLLIKNNTAIQEKSGLNWGQRLGREPNQAYLPVPSSIHKENPNFFPPSKQPFMLITDDGNQFISIMAQANRKAIETSESNSLLGKYFRNRLNVPLGSKVTVDDILSYGRFSVRIYKMDSSTYYMDFKVPLIN